MGETETIQTVYGDVEIPVVQCDSCGDTIAKDDANEFTIGNRNGYACDYCADTGPINFPGRDRVNRWAQGDFAALATITLFAPVALPMLLLVIIGDFVNGQLSESHDILIGTVVGAIAASVWFTVVIALILAA